MATATKPKPGTTPVPATVTFAEIAQRKMRERIEQYRQSVQRAAAGEMLHGEELAQVLEALTYMGLPEYAWDRDVQAQRNYSIAEQSVAEAMKQKPANEARLAEVVARIKTMEEELQALRAERYTLAEVEPMTRVGAASRINELRFNHPHVFADVAEAVQLRQEAKAKATGGRPVPPAEGITTWSIGG